MDVHEMKLRKISLGCSCEMISRCSGVPLETVQKIFEDDEPIHHFETWRALSDFFETPVHKNFIHDSSSVYGKKHQGEYTLEDYRRIPDDMHVELIDGVIYDRNAPSLIHQLITGFLHAKLLAYITSHHKACIPLLSPLDVQLDQDEHTMVQPDLMILCDRDKLFQQCVFGAPDFIIEVLSPSTRRTDMIIKRNKYMTAGVREYWMIDPEKKCILVYDFARDQKPMIFGFDDNVPIHLWNGECFIDFREVYEHIRFLYEREERN